MKPSNGYLELKGTKLLWLFGLYNCIFCFSSLGVPGAHDPIERLKERHGKGVTEGGAVETPSKRTKKTDKSKLVRQVKV